MSPTCCPVRSRLRRRSSRPRRQAAAVATATATAKSTVSRARLAALGRVALERLDLARQFGHLLLEVGDLIPRRDRDRGPHAVGDAAAEILAPTAGVRCELIEPPAALLPADLPPVQPGVDHMVPLLEGPAGRAQHDGEAVADRLAETLAARRMYVLAAW